MMQQPQPQPQPVYYAPPVRPMQTVQYARPPIAPVQAPYGYYQPAPAGPGMRFAQGIYDSSASLGKVTGIFQGITGIFIGIIVLAISIALIVRKEPRVIVDATVKKAECTDVTETVNNKKQITKNCVLTLNFYTKDTNKLTEVTLSSNDKSYAEGQIVKISYDSTNPLDVQMHKITLRTVGWILLAISILIIAGSGFRIYVSRNYKLAQSAEGLGYAVGAVSDGFR